MLLLLLSQSSREIAGNKWRGDPAVLTRCTGWSCRDDKACRAREHSVNPMLFVWQVKVGDHYLLLTVILNAMSRVDLFEITVILV